MRAGVLLVAALVMPALAVPTVAQAQTPSEARVMNGFMRHGMTRDKAWCYSQIIGQMLGQDTGKAAAIVEAAPDGPSIQQGVMNGGPPMINAFSAAHNTCGQ